MHHLLETINHSENMATQPSSAKHRSKQKPASKSKVILKPLTLKKKSSASSAKSSSHVIEGVYYGLSFDPVFQRVEVIGWMGNSSCRQTISLHVPTAQLTQIADLLYVFAKRITDGSQLVITSEKPNTTPSSKPSFRRNGLHFGSVVKWIRGVLYGKARTTGK